jgi:chromosome segregation ATPase
MTATQTPSPRDSTLGLNDLARSYLSRRSPVAWIEWLPLAEVALDDPEAWVRAFCALQLEQQYDLVDLLRADDAGPLADTLLVLLAPRAGDIADEQVRLNVLSDALVAQGRRGARLRALEEQAEALRAQLDHGRDRLREGFDRAREVAALEEELARVRLREAEQDGDFAQIRELERELLRMETRGRILAGYDAPARRRLLEELREQVEAGEAVKRETEQEVVRATTTLEALRHEAGALAEALREATAERDALRARAAELAEAVPRLRTEAEEHRREAARLEAEHRGLGDEASAAARAREDAAERLAAERRRLDELSAAAEVVGREDIRRKIQEVYDLLPADAAERAL